MLKHNHSARTNRIAAVSLVVAIFVVVVVALSLFGGKKNSPSSLKSPAVRPTSSSRQSAAPSTTTTAPPTPSTLVHAPTPTSTTTTTVPLPIAPKSYSPVTGQALNDITQYIDERENQNSVTQQSPTSWVQAIKPYVSSSFYAQMSQQGSAPSPQGEWDIAQKGGYIVNAQLSDCLWNGGIEPLTPTSAAISCNLTDITEFTNGQAVPPSQINYGWQYEGQQVQVDLLMINNGSGWVVNQDVSGQGNS